MESFNIVRDFSLLLAAAGVAAVAARLLHFPLLLAYILGGMILNIPFGGQELIHEQGIIHQLSELGVLFLMFYMGLEFDLKKLRQLFGPAILALFFQTFFMLFLGRVLAPILGWGGLNGLFLGGLLAISSTMITLPILAEQRVLKNNFARLCMGILIFEDILAILLLVILSGIAITGYFDWDALGRIIFLVGAFVMTIFFLGRISAPAIIRTLQKFDSEEVLTVAIVGFLFAVGLLAEISHFSTALGAFLAGAIFSNTDISESIEKHMQPIRALFSAIFFLSIGMMANPQLLWKSAIPILILTVLVFTLKLASCFLGLFLSGQSGEDSFCASVAKAQIGEFSFVIASLGASLGVTNDAMLSIAIGVSLGTILCTAFLSPRAKEIQRIILRIWPKSLLSFSNIYRNTLIVVRSRISQNTLLKLAGKPMIYIVIETFLFLSILVVASFSVKFVDNMEIFDRVESYVGVGIWTIAGLLSLPILIPIVKQCNVLFLALVENAMPTTKLRTRSAVAPRIVAIFQSVIFATILILFGGIFLSVAAPTLPKGVPLYFFLCLLIFAGLLLRRRMLRLNARVESYFVETFNRNVASQLERQKRAMLKKIQAQSPLQLDLLEVPIVDGNCGCNCPIIDLELREKFNVNVVALRHGSYSTFSPSVRMPLFSGSELILLGAQKDLERARTFFSTPFSGDGDNEGVTAVEDFEITRLCVQLGHPFAGKSLVESQLRKKYSVSVVEIQREKESIPLPSAGEVLRANDALVIIGAESAIRRTISAWDSSELMDGHGTSSSLDS
ncbi:MAG: cation:proton antiporter [Puniceicoccales bacterium]|nr:cation:proton antiporter [Puniceicoccales bacterium]